MGLWDIQVSGTYTNYLGQQYTVGPGSGAIAYQFTPLPTATAASFSPAAAATSTGVNPVEINYTLYGRTMPLSVLGHARIGGTISVGPWIENGLASFGISFGVPADPTGSRILGDIAFDSELVWHNETEFATEEFTFRFYEGTYTQAADPLEIAHFGVNAVAYRPQMMIFFENLPLANTKFRKIPYVSARIADGVGTDVNLGECFERLAYSPWVELTSSQFETVGVTDALVNGGMIFAEPAEFLGTIQQFGRFYRTWDILQTDKLRIVDRGATVTADLTLDKTRLIDKVTVTRQEPNSVPRRLELSTIEAESDYTVIPSTAQRPLAPVAVTASVATESAYLPVIMDSSTRIAVVTYAKYAEERARNKFSGTAMAYGLEIEPGALVELADLGDEFEDETIKIIETLHGANYVVEFTGESILKCDVDIPEGGTTTPPAADSIWAVSRSRILVEGYAGPWDSVVSGRVDILYDQSGNGNDLSALTSAKRPIATTSGPNSRECCDFSPINIVTGHEMQTDSVAQFAGSTFRYMVMSLRPDTVTTNNATYAIQNARAMQCIFSLSSYCGMTLRSTGVLNAMNHINGEGALSQYNAASAADAVEIGGNPCVIEWRHESGVLYQRVNGAGETSVATSGFPVDPTGSIKLGGANLYFYDGKIFEALAYSTVPDLAARDALVADLMAWVGAS